MQLYCLSKKEVIDMPYVCPMEGCKKEKGMCIHDKMMLVGLVIVVVVLLYMYL